MNTQNTQLSENSQQLSRANEALLQIAPDVTIEDKKSAYKKYNRATVSKYLSGKGSDLDIAIKLLKLFSDRIAKRAQIIESIGV